MTVSARLDVWCGLVLLAVLNAADVVTTRAALAHPDGAEGNPVAGWLLANGLLEFAKLTVVSALCLLVWRSQRHRRWVSAGVWLACGWYAAAVAGNVLVARA